MTQEKQLAKANELALKILNLSRNSLLVKLRFLENALAGFTFQVYSGTVGTDGAVIYYQPLHILKRYREGKNIPLHDYLHMVLHCIYRHSFVGYGINCDIWDTACDIAVENQIMELNLEIIDNPNINQKRKLISKLNRKVKFLSAEHIYAYFTEHQSEVSSYSGLFAADDHSMWYNEVLMALSGSSGEEEDNSETLNINVNGNNSSESDYSDKSDINESQNSAESENRSAFRKQLEEQWIDISEQVQSELENFAKERGYTSGSMIMSLKEVNRERYDYTEFLKKFAVMGEVMKIDMDEFDYNFYSYGMQLYGNVALIEPLEYKEVKRIREFVIAIDTSGSVSQKLVHVFMTKTFNILKNTDSFFSKVNIWIIQCDTKIQEAVQITNQDEFDKYIKNMKLKGFGGTDFRPVFSYVDEMQKQKILSNLKGMIYFTDGYGIFPKHKPEYETAFIFLRSDYEKYGSPDVPAWAIKLILEDNDII